MEKDRVNEIDIENWLYEHPEALNVDQWIGKQLIMPSGRLDLLGIRYDDEFDAAYELVIVELKKEGATAESFTQICRYAKDIEIILERINGWGYCTDIKKLIISNNYSELSTKILFEAKALDIDIMGYRTKIEFEISGKWNWTETYADKLDKHYEELSNSDTFNILRKLNDEGALSNE